MGLRDECFRVTRVAQVNKLAQQCLEYEIAARYSSKEGARRSTAGKAGRVSSR